MKKHNRNGLRKLAAIVFSMTLLVAYLPEHIYAETGTDSSEQQTETTNPENQPRETQQPEDSAIYSDSEQKTPADTSMLQDNKNDEDPAGETTEDSESKDTAAEKVKAANDHKEEPKKCANQNADSVNSEHGIDTSAPKKSSVSPRKVSPEKNNNGTENIPIIDREKWIESIRNILLRSESDISFQRSPYEMRNGYRIDAFKDYTKDKYVIYVNNNGNKVYWWSNAEKIYLPEDASSMFQYCPMITSIDMTGIDASNTKNIGHMFDGCSRLKNLNLSGFNTKSTVSMQGMFQNCSSLTSLDLSGFDTSNVTVSSDSNNMSNMFMNCHPDTIVFGKDFNKKPESLDGMYIKTKDADGSTLNDQNATTFEDAELNKLPGTWYKAKRIKRQYRLQLEKGENNFSEPQVIDDKYYTIGAHIDAWSYEGSNKDKYTSKGIPAITVTNDTSSQISIDLYLISQQPNSTWQKNWDYNTENSNIIIRKYTGTETGTEEEPYVIPSKAIINGVEYTTELGKVTNAVSLSDIHFDTGSIKYLIIENGVILPTDCNELFMNNSQLIDLDMTGVDASNVTSMSSMFSSCKKLKNLKFADVDTRNVTCMNYMFSDCHALSSLDLSNFDTSKIGDMSYMFSDCHALSSLDVSSFDTRVVTNMSNMFSDCEALSTLNLSNFKTIKVTDMSGMFKNCSSLTNLDVSKFDTSNVTDMGTWEYGGMFAGCSSLTELNLSNFNTQNVLYMSYMFRGCTKLTKLIFSNKFDTSNVTDMSSMFSNCSNLKSLDLSNFNTGNVPDYSMIDTFGNCSPDKIIFGENFRLKENNYLEGNYLSADNVKKEPADENDLVVLNDKLNTSDIAGTWYKAKQIERKYRLQNKDGSFGREYKTLDNKYYGISSTIPQTKVDAAKDDNYQIAVFPETEIKETTEILKTDVKLKNTTWQGDWTYDTDETSHKIKLKEYKGSAANYTVPAVAEINSNEYITELSRYSNPTNQEGKATGIDTGKITSLSFQKGVTLPDDSSYLFANSKLTTLNLANIDSMNVNDMSGMFSGSQMTSLTFPAEFNTDRVNDMSQMFADNTKLTSLDVSHFNTSKVTNISNIFSNCKNLDKIVFGNQFDKNPDGLSGQYVKLRKLDNTSILPENRTAKTLTELDLNADPYALAGTWYRVDPSNIKLITRQYQLQKADGNFEEPVLIDSYYYAIDEIIPAWTSSSLNLREGIYQSANIDEITVKSNTRNPEPVKIERQIMTVTFDANGGSLKKNEVTVPIEGMIDSLETPTKTGYHFNNWRTEDGKEITGKEKINSDITYYAYWQKVMSDIDCIDAIPNQKWTGSQIEPTPVVKEDGKLLKVNKDYTVTYKNNRNVGEKAAVIINFKGDYYGTRTQYFEIEDIKVPAKNEVSKHATSGENSIDGLKDLSDARKLDYKDKVDSTVSNADKDIGEAKSDVDVKKAKDTAISDIDLIQDKAKAVNEINAEAKTIKAGIEKIADADFSENEKKSFEESINTETSSAIINIDDAKATQNVTDAKTSGLKAIDDIYKAANKKSLGNRATAASTSIDNLANLSDDERTKFKGEVGTAVNNANKGIDSAKNTDDVSSAAKEGLNNIDIVLNNAQVQNQKNAETKAIAEIDEKAISAKSVIDTLDEFSDEEKATYKDKIDIAVTTAKQNISAANTEAAVDTAKKSGIKTINDHKSDAVELNLKRVKVKAVSEIKDKGETIKSAIDNLSDLTDDDRKSYKDKVDAAVKSGNDAVNAAKNVADAKNQKDACLTNIDTLKKEAQASNLKHIQEKADSEIAEKGKTAKKDIDALKYLSDTEKTKFKDDIDTAVKNTKVAIDSAKNASDVSTKKSNGFDAIKKVSDEATDRNQTNAEEKAVNEVADKGTEAKKTIGGIQEPINTDFNKQLNDIVEKAKVGIRKTNDLASVTKLKGEAVNSIDQTVDNAYIEAVQIRADAEKQDIDHNKNLSDQEKKTFNDQIDQIVNDAADRIKASADKNVVKDKAIADIDQTETIAENISSLNPVSSQAEKDIKQLNKLSEEEKEEYCKKIEKALTDGKAAIAKTSDKAGAEGEKNTAIANIQSIYKTASDADLQYIRDDGVSELEKYGSEAKDDINSMQYLYTDQQKEMCGNIDDHVKEAKQKISETKNAYGVTDQVNTAKLQIDDVKDHAEKVNAQNKADQKAADAVTAEINELPDDVKLTDKAAVKNAREAYNKLTDAQKAKVRKEATDKLTDAEKQITDLENNFEKGVKIDGIVDQDWTGSEISQDITVTYDDLTLKEGTDYTAAYTDNVKPGTATVTLTFQGSYPAISKALKFQIRDIKKPAQDRIDQKVEKGAVTSKPRVK